MQTVEQIEQRIQKLNKVKEHAGKLKELRIKRLKNSKMPVPYGFYGPEHAERMRYIWSDYWSVCSMVKRETEILTRVMNG